MKRRFKVKILKESSASGDGEEGETEEGSGVEGLASIQHRGTEENGAQRRKGRKEQCHAELVSASYAKYAKSFLFRVLSF